MVQLTFFDMSEFVLTDGERGRIVYVLYRDGRDSVGTRSGARTSTNQRSGTKITKNAKTTKNY